MKLRSIQKACALFLLLVSVLIPAKVGLGQRFEYSYSLGRSAGLFWGVPLGAVVDSESCFWMSDYSGRFVRRFNSEGILVSQFSVSDISPGDIAIDSQNQVWIPSYHTGTLNLYSSTGQLLKTISGYLTSPVGIAKHANGDMYVADAGSNRIVVFDQVGTYKSEFVSVNRPCYLNWSSDGELYVTGYNTNIGVYDTAGILQRYVPNTDGALGICFDRQQNLVIVDQGKHLVRLVSKAGVELASFGGEGTADNQFRHPNVCGLIPTGQVVIGDEWNGRVQVLDIVYPDVLPPTSTFSSTPTTFWSNSNVTATIASTDNAGGTGVKEIHFSINQGTEQVITGSSALFTVSDEGVYSIAYWAVDNAGNIEATKYGSVRIDKTAPSIDGYVLSGKLTLLASDGRSGVAAIKYSLDGATVVTYTSPLTIPAGAHTYTFYSVDNAGNESVKETILVGATVSVTLVPTSVYASKSSVATIKLSVAAPVGGVTVMLASSNPAVTIAPSVKLNAGATSINVPVQTGAVAADTSAVITATVGGIESYATLVVMVPYPKTLVISPNVITGGNTATGTVSLQSAAPAGGQLVTLTSMHPDVTVPSTVTVLAGALSANFTVTTKVASKDYSAAIYAEADDAGIGTTVLVKRVTPKSVTFAPSSIVGGNTSVGTVTLNVAAPTGGATVMLKSTSSLVTLPTSVQPLMADSGPVVVIAESHQRQGLEN